MNDGGPHVLHDDVAERHELLHDVAATLGRHVDGQAEHAQVELIERRAAVETDQAQDVGAAPRLDFDHLRAEESQQLCGFGDHSATPRLRTRKPLSGSGEGVRSLTG